MEHGHGLGRLNHILIEQALDGVDALFLSLPKIKWMSLFRK
jgi:hypothetical protein